MRVLVILVVLVAVILAAIVIARVVLFSRDAGAQAERMTSAFVPDRNNRISLVVRGWNRADLDRILSDFLQLYDLPKPFARNIFERPDGALAVTFPDDIRPEFLFYLVNYVKYPKNFDLTNRSIAVLCHVVLTPAFGAPDAALVGQRAIIYVLAQDTDYDLVYARLETGAAYKISFTNLIWESVADPRMPRDFGGL